MRSVILLILLAGCSPPMLTAYNEKGEPIKPVIVVMAPFYLSFCSTQITTAGSSVRAVSDQVNTSNSQTQSPSQNNTRGAP
jgi:hypothetical protein